MRKADAQHECDLNETCRGYVCQKGYDSCQPFTSDPYTDYVDGPKFEMFVKRNKSEPEPYWSEWSPMCNACGSTINMQTRDCRGGKCPGDTTKKCKYYGECSTTYDGLYGVYPSVEWLSNSSNAFVMNNVDNNTVFDLVRNYKYAGYMYNTSKRSATIYVKPPLDVYTMEKRDPDDSVMFERIDATRKGMAGPIPNVWNDCWPGGVLSRECLDDQCDMYNSRRFHCAI